jgi:hypothetical protein
MTIQITPDKTVPYPDTLDPDEVSTLRENMHIAANTAAVLKEYGAQYDQTPEDKDEADKVFADFAKLAERQYHEAMRTETPSGGLSRPRVLRQPKPKMDLTPLQRPSVAERIGTMLREYDNQFVADAAQLRLVVTNKLLDLAGCGDPRIEIKAAEMLGKMSDVGLFSEKTEITVTYKSVSDIDEAIKDKIRKMMRIHATDVTALDIDIDVELGLKPKPSLEMVEEVPVISDQAQVFSPPSEIQPNA